MNIKSKVLKLHSKNIEKIEIAGKIQIENRYDLAIIYVPSVAKRCKKIGKNINKVYEYTN